MRAPTPTPSGYVGTIDEVLVELHVDDDGSIRLRDPATGVDLEVSSLAELRTGSRT